MRKLIPELLVGAACLCGCAIEDGPVARDDDQGYGVARATSPLQNATPSMRSDVVAVMTTRGIEEQLCTGTVLLPNLVLTARHCLITDRSAIESGDCATAIVAEPDELTRVVVVPGKDVDLVPADAQHAVREYILPDNEGKLCGQDIALLVLATPIEGTLAVITSDPPDVESPFTAVGYGLFDGDWGQQRESRSAKLKCSAATCADERIVGREWLAASGACEGDSGGPAFDATGRQFAIASRSTSDCAETAYLALRDYVPWLRLVAAHAAAMGGYEAPVWAQPSEATDDSGAPPAKKSTYPEGQSLGGGCTVALAGAGAGMGDARDVGAWFVAMLAVVFGSRRRVGKWVAKRLAFRTRGFDRAAAGREFNAD